MEQEPVVILRGETIALGPLRKDLLDTYTRWVNDLRVTRTLNLPSMPYSREKQEQWLDQALVATDEAIFTIFLGESMRPVGNVGLHDIDYDSGTADFGILIGEPDVWGQGIGTEAARLMVGYGFDVLGLHNIELKVFAHNPGGVRAYEKAGFRRVGVRRGAKKVGRQRVDEIIMDIVADDVEPSGLHRLMQTGRFE